MNIGEKLNSLRIERKLTHIFHVSTDYLLGIEHTRCIDLTGLNDSEIEIIS